MLAEVNLHDVCRIRRIIILKNCTHKALIKQIIALLLSFMIIISISVPSYAINYDSRTKAIKTSVKKAQKIIADNPIHGACAGFERAEHCKQKSCSLPGESGKPCHEQQQAIPAQ